MSDLVKVLERGTVAVTKIHDLAQRLRKQFEDDDEASIKTCSLLREAADEIDSLRSQLAEARKALEAYRLAQKWATGTEEHRLAIEAADTLNPLPQWYDLARAAISSSAIKDNLTGEASSPPVVVPCP